MIILGLNAYHADASACLLKDGELVAAAEEERFRRIKHWAGFPEQAVRYCLEEAGITLGDVGHVAVNQDSHANLLEKVTYAVARRPSLGLVVDRVRNKRKRAGVGEELSRMHGSAWHGRVHAVEHHLAHLASAYLVSGFGEAVVASVDGFGDFASAAWGRGSGGSVDVDDRIYFPHSLGVFYEALTQYLGFPNYGDEYKVMGLAPYGEPRFMEQIRRVVRLEDDGRFNLALEYFRHHDEKVPYEWDGGEPRVGALYSGALEELLGRAREPQAALESRHRDIARSVQVMYEEAFFHLLNGLHARYGGEALCLSGGCAMNSVANGKVYAKTPFRRMYVQAAAGDAGGAIGAALIARTRLAPSAASLPVMHHAAWGPHFADGEIHRVIEEQRARLDGVGAVVIEVKQERELVGQVAGALANGAVVGWFQGRMEWGPRALGNRSILADPRRSDMKELLNLKIKRRESFRPFAPSILREAVADWFETDDEVPFMTHVYRIREEKRALIPAVTHVDGTGRLQTVTRESNPLYYSLIGAFATLTGVPMILNTSFNENEPLVCRPAEAIDCFLRTRMDVLVLGSWLVRRQGG
jgi:carbamoyltransferase